MASFCSGDYVGAVVLDVGSCDTKMGWAGDDAPRSFFRSVRSAGVVYCGLDLQGMENDSDTGVLLHVPFFSQFCFLPFQCKLYSNVLPLAVLQLLLCEHVSCILLLRGCLQLYASL